MLGPSPTGTFGGRLSELKNQSAPLKYAGRALIKLSKEGFVEYFEPFSGESLGSREQSRTVAVVLDLLEVTYARHKIKAS